MSSPVLSCSTLCLPQVYTDSGGQSHSTPTDDCCTHCCGHLDRMMASQVSETGRANHVVHVREVHQPSWGPTQSSPCHLIFFPSAVFANVNLHAALAAICGKYLDFACRWKWLFMLEGVITVIFGVLFYVSNSCILAHLACGQLCCWLAAHPMEKRLLEMTSRFCSCCSLCALWEHCMPQCSQSSLVMCSLGCLQSRSRPTSSTRRNVPGWPSAREAKRRSAPSRIRTLAAP